MLCIWAWEVGYSELGYPRALGDSLAITQGWVGRSLGGPSHTVWDCGSTMAAALIQKLWLLLGKIRSWPLVILIITLTLLTWSVLRDSRLVVLKHECAADHWSFVKLLYVQSESLLTSTPGAAEEGGSHFEKQWCRRNPLLGLLLITLCMRI